MEAGRSKMDEPAADVEKQLPLLLPAAAACCKACACSRTSPTATRTLALVVLATGAAFAAQLAAREQYVLLAFFASQLLGFCVFTSLLALCALPAEDGGARRLAWAHGAAAQVLLWSFAMALVVSMACWVAESAPVALGAPVLALALAVVFACFTELVQSLWLVS